MITVSSPAKVILMGEHSVVYGRPALLAAIDRRLFVTILKHQGLHIPQGESTLHIKNILSHFSDNLKKEINNLKITIRSDIPYGRHIGSSAALSVALFAALMRFYLKVWDPKRINELAYETEKIIHGNPSGADNTICCFGGLVWYRKETEFLKSIWSLPITSYKIPQFILIDTGKPLETTGEMVASVKKLYTQKPKYIENILNDQEKQTKRILIDLKEGNLLDLKKAIMIGERNLEKLGVVSSSTIEIIKKLEKIGATAKICGGGGKKGPTGFLLVYHENTNKLLEITKTLHLHAFPVKLGEEGVRVENG